MSNITVPPELPSELDAHIETDEQRERFKLDDDKMATWAMRKLATIRAKQRENINIADDEVQRVTEWVESVNKPLERDASFFENLLADYGRRQRVEHDRKSISLPHGEIKTRAGSDKWLINTALTLEWLRANGHSDLIKVKEEPSLTAMKEAFITDGERALTQDGEVVPGIAVQHSEFTVSVSTDK
jgi:hypothetical protein